MPEIIWQKMFTGGCDSFEAKPTHQEHLNGLHTIVMRVLAYMLPVGVLVSFKTWLTNRQKNARKKMEVKWERGTN